MAKRLSQPIQSGRTFLVLEFEHVYKGPDAGIAVITSVVREDGPQCRLWPAKVGMLNSRQLDDLVATVAHQVRDAVVGFVGVQEMMPAD